MTPKQLHAAIAILRQEVPHWDAPVVTLMAQEKREPYRVLISTLLSLRTQDQTTAKASQRLFALADTPQAMLTLDRQTIERAIYPVGFYRNKAAQILDISQRLLARVWRTRAGRYRRPDHIPRRGPQDGQSRAGRGLRHPRHLRGYACAPHLQSLGLCENQRSTGHRNGLAQETPRQYWIEYNPTLVALGSASL